jgi:uncharacterized iron-regulated membrane protein
MKAGLARSLHLVHRWLGIGAGLLVLCWFVSGLVMIYVPFPKLTAEERLPKLAPIQAEAIRISPAEAARLCPGEPRSLRLSTLDDRPVFHFLGKGGACSVWADSGLPVGPVSAEAAAKTARRFLGAETVGSIDTIERDQWTVYTSYNAHRPLYRIAAGDAAGTVLYVSSRSGEVLVDTTRFERGWSWIGTVLHWIYFTPLRDYNELWRQILLWLSFPALLTAATGLWLGIKRLRLKKRYPRGHVTPYKGVKRWHHLLGLTAGGVTLTWLLSGWLSQHPFGLLELSSPPPGAARQLAGGPLQASGNPDLLRRQLARLPDAREAEWFRFGGRDYLELRSPAGTARTDDQAQAAAPFSVEALAKAVHALEGIPIAKAELIHEPDLYYYGHRSPKPLPVARIRLADNQDTTYYMDPASGRILLRLDDANRRHRWLFNALHRFDFPPIGGLPALWNVVVTTLCLLGAALAGSGCVIGWRRLGSRHQPHR